MSKQGFTPGPWRLMIDDPEQRFEIAHESEVSEPGCIAWVFAADADDMYGEAMANARLIAAAPDLLAALIALEGDCWCPWDRIVDHHTAPCIQARAAIAKARGEASGG